MKRQVKLKRRLPLLLGALLCGTAPVAVSAVLEVVSRGYTVTNLLSTPLVLGDVSSASYTVTNLLSTPLILRDVSSASYTVTNLLGTPEHFIAATSHSYTVTNNLSDGTIYSEATSPSITVIQSEPVVRGDCNWDTYVTIQDYSCLAACVSGPNGGVLPSPCDGCVPCCLYDFDLDGNVDLCDFAEFQKFYRGW